MQMCCLFWDYDTRIWVELSGQSTKITAQIHTTDLEFCCRICSITSGKTNTFFLCLISSCHNNISLIQRSVVDILFTSVKLPWKDTVQFDSALAIHDLPPQTSLTTWQELFLKRASIPLEPQVAGEYSNAQQSVLHTRFTQWSPLVFDAQSNCSAALGAQ